MAKREQAPRSPLASLTAGLAIAIAGAIAATAPAAAQNTDIKARLYEQPLGVPISELPDRYFDPHCGTNGGPPSTRLASFADFAVCPLEPGTGLHEVWFSEDDEAEYVTRAYRAQRDDYGPSAANILYVHKVIYSLLIDDNGLVQGYRIVTNPDEEPGPRFDAEWVGDAMRGLYGYGRFACVNLDPLEGEIPIEGVFIKTDCMADFPDGRHITIKRRFFYKPGQLGIDPLTGEATVNQFESSARIDVIASSLVQPPAGSAPAP